MSLFLSLKSFLKRRYKLPLKVTDNVLVLGSGPGSSIPSMFDGSWTLITINASQAAIAGDITPDFTLVGTSTLRNKPANREAKAALRGRKTRTLILFDRGKLIDNQRLKLLGLGYSYDRVVFVSTTDRLGWIRGATGADLGDKPSNGIAAAFLCASLGAKRILMTGFSLTKEGHAYNEKNRERAHVQGDRMALHMALMRGMPILTNQSDFAGEAGVPYFDAD